MSGISDAIPKDGISVVGELDVSWNDHDSFKRADRAFSGLLGSTSFVQRKGLSSVGRSKQPTQTILLDGKACAQQWQDEMAHQVRRIQASAGRAPGLGVVLVGDRLDSHVYVMRKREACESIGIVSKVAYLPGEGVQQHHVRKAVQSLCHDSSIDGVLVQLPLPRHIDEEDVIEHFDPRKDVDGFHPLNVGRTLMRGRTARFVPCTALGCIELLKRSHVDVLQKTVVIVGDSNIVGMPLAMLFRDQGAGSVTIIHRSSFSTAGGRAHVQSNDSNCGKGPVSYQARETDRIDMRRSSMDDPPHPYKVTYSNSMDTATDGHHHIQNPFSPQDIRTMKDMTCTADILVIAIGYPELVDDSWIKPGAVVLDVGINSVSSECDQVPDMTKPSMITGTVHLENHTSPLYETLLEGVKNHQHLHSIVGDVDATSLQGKAAYVSPVPGGIGPMTVAALLHNTIASASWRLGVPLNWS